MTNSVLNEVGCANCFNIFEVTDAEYSSDDTECPKCHARDVVDADEVRDEDDFEDWKERGFTFADPGGRSALRAATPSNRRNLSCPNCGTPNVLTPQDRSAGYQCDRCADQLESGY